MQAGKADDLARELRDEKAVGFSQPLQSPLDLLAARRVPELAEEPGKRGRVLPPGRPNTCAHAVTLRAQAYSPTP